MKKILILIGVVAFTVSMCNFVFADDENDMLKEMGVVLRGPAKLPPRATNQVTGKAATAVSSATNTTSDAEQELINQIYSLKAAYTNTENNVLAVYQTYYSNNGFEPTNWLSFNDGNGNSFPGTTQIIHADNPMYDTAFLVNDISSCFYLHIIDIIAKVGAAAATAPELMSWNIPAGVTDLKVTAGVNFSIPSIIAWTFKDMPRGCKSSVIFSEEVAPGVWGENYLAAKYRNSNGDLSTFTIDELNWTIARLNTLINEANSDLQDAQNTTTAVNQVFAEYVTNLKNNAETIAKPEDKKPILKGVIPEADQKREVEVTLQNQRNTGYYSPKMANNQASSLPASAVSNNKR